MGGPDLKFEPLSPHHLDLRKDFDCGVEPLNHYLAERARKESEQGVARVHVLYDEASHRIAGFYTLSSMSIRFTDVPNSLTKRLPRYPELPATLIGRLAIDSRYQGQGLGKMLVLDAFAKIQEQAKTVATFLVVVDAKDEEGVNFYARFQFRRFPDHPLRLYLPTRQIPSPLS